VKGIESEGRNVADIVAGMIVSARGIATAVDPEQAAKHA
jgi:hypothetical protein